MSYSALRKNAWLLALFLFSIVHFGLSVAPAKAAFPQDGYVGPARYEIENAASGKLIELNRQDGRTVQQWTRDRHRSQLWDIQDAEDGFVYILSAENGMALDIQGGARDGARITLSPATGSDSQMWMIEHGGDDLIRITSRLGRAIDLPHGSRLDGAVFETWAKISQNNQRFRLIRIADLPTGFSRIGRRRGDGQFHDGRINDVRINEPFPSRNRSFCSSDNAFDEKSSYELGYCLGVEDFKGRLRRTFTRHKQRFDRRWDESFIEGYYDGYDAGHTETANMRLEEKDVYTAGYRLGQQDYRDSKRPDYSRHAGRFDNRAEQVFRRGYQDGFFSNR